MTRPGNEPRSPGPLVNTVPTMPIYTYIYMCVCECVASYICVCVCVCVCRILYIYIYIYVYLGSISSLMHISLNIIDIFCLHIFLLILSYCRIDFIIFDGNWLMNLP